MLGYSDILEKTNEIPLRRIDETLGKVFQQQPSNKVPIIDITHHFIEQVIKQFMQILWGEEKR